MPPGQSLSSNHLTVILTLPYIWTHTTISKLAQNDVRTLLNYLPKLPMQSNKQRTDKHTIDLGFRDFVSLPNPDV